LIDVSCERRDDGLSVRVEVEGRDYGYVLPAWFSEREEFDGILNACIFVIDVLGDEPRVVGVDEPPRLAAHLAAHRRWNERHPGLAEERRRRLRARLGLE
jgi:hypothetical protein